MRNLAREPLLHFFVLGAALTALYGLLNRGSFDSANEIVVSQGQQQNLRAQFERVWRRPPTESELGGLIDSWVREEIFYREGLAMGLDQDDPVVRRRIGQKVQFILDSVTPAKPTDAELTEWLDAHVETYQIEARYSFEQVYFEPQRHGDRLAADLDAGRAALEGGELVTGDSSMLPAEMSASAMDVVRAFGSEFEGALRELPIGGWQAPVKSGFGVHLVRLNAREPGRAALLHEVRAAVERDLLRERADQAAEQFYQRLRMGYAVRIEDAAAGPAG